MSDLTYFEMCLYSEILNFQFHENDSSIDEKSTDEYEFFSMDEKYEGLYDRYHDEYDIENLD